MIALKCFVTSSKRVSSFKFEAFNAVPAIAFEPKPFVILSFQSGISCSISTGVFSPKVMVTLSTVIAEGFSDVDIIPKATNLPSGLIEALP